MYILSLLQPDVLHRSAGSQNSFLFHGGIFGKLTIPFVMPEKQIDE